MQNGKLIAEAVTCLVIGDERSDGRYHISRRLAGHLKLPFFQKQAVAARSQNAAGPDVHFRRAWLQTRSA